MVRRSLVILLAALAPLLAQGQQTYAVDTTWFKNPERGFFEWARSHRTPSDSTGQGFWRILASQPDSLSLIFEEFVLHDYKTSDISQAYLNMMQAEFNNLRKFGMKAIVRFCYVTSSDWGQTVPPDTIGTDISWMKTHIAQVQPVIRANIDVIAFFQAGFMGRWGEWGGGAGTIGVAHPDYARDTVAQAELLSSLLAMLPASRMVDVRTPRYKFWYLRDERPMTLNDWLSGSAKGRIGQHNDAFHGSFANSGTFYDYNVHDTTFFRSWYRTDTRFGGIVAEQAGEWKSPYDPSWFPDLNGWYLSFVRPLGRENAEMANQHVTSIQVLPGVWTDGMKARGLWNTARRRLGYRFQLIDAEIPGSGAPGRPFRLRFKVINTGWSSPRNPRGLALVLRRDSSGSETAVSLFRHKHSRLDPRLWWPGDTIQVDTTLNLPPGIAPGTYAAFLHLPDTSTSIRRRPEYAIRLANRDVWEASSGYNDLRAEIRVSDAPIQEAGEGAAPLEFGVEQNYPNPFNPWTTIRYTIPQGTLVQVEVFNLLGQKIRTLVDGYQEAGWHSVQWSGENDAGIKAGSGLYIYRVRAGDQSVVRTMAIVR